MPVGPYDDPVNLPFTPVKKDTNPKDAVGTGKVPLSTIPTEVLAELGLVMLEGARKYGRHNYRAAGVRASVYYDAAIRHLFRFWEGEDIDPDSGMPHLIHVMACAAVLRDSQFYGNWTDDRPPKLPDGWLNEMNERAKAIVEKYPNPVEAHTESTRKIRQTGIIPLRLPAEDTVLHVSPGFLPTPVDLDTRPLADGHAQQQ